MTSYTFSERVNVHSILFWTVAIPVYRTAVAIDKTCQAIMAMLPALLLALASVGKALALAGSVALVVAVVAMIPPTFWLGLLIVGAFGWVTFPRAKAVK